MSSRIALTDGSNQWFDADKATEFKEDTWFNGSNQISKATGSQWDHQSLYLTAGGAWVVEEFSQYQDKPTTYTEITAQEAASWLISNNEDDTEALPETVRDLIKETLSETEL